MIFALFGLVVGAAIGACIEAHRHRCPDPNAALLASLDQAQKLAADWNRAAVQQEARYRIAANAAVRYARGARYWHSTATGHAEVLAALGRVVAEGGTVAGTTVVDPRHPSQRRDDAA